MPAQGFILHVGDILAWADAFHEDGERGHALLLNWLFILKD